MSLELVARPAGRNQNLLGPLLLLLLDDLELEEEEEGHAIAFDMPSEYGEPMVTTTFQICTTYQKYMEAGQWLNRDSSSKRSGSVHGNFLFVQWPRIGPVSKLLDTFL